MKIGSGDLGVGEWAGVLVAVSAVLVGASGGLGQPCEGLEYPRQGIHLGSNPMAIEVVDLNNDGLVDLVIMSDDIIVVLNEGGWEFRTPARYDHASVANSYGLRIADVNADGFQDVIAIGPTNNFSVLMGIGDGTFGAPLVTDLTPLAIDPNYNVRISASVILDVDLDGHNDVLLQLSNAGQIYWLLRGNGDGSFGEPSPFEFYQVFSNWVVTGDFDNSGQLDLVFTRNPRSPEIVVLLSDGNGGYLPEQVTPTDLRLNGLEAADCNGDAIDDLIVPNGYPANSFATFLSNGDGTFSEPRLNDVGAPADSVVSEDLNHDGNLDAIVVCGDWLCIFAGLGDGYFEQIDVIPWLLVPVPAIGDFDGDSNPDLAVGNWSEKGFFFFLGHGDGTFARSIELITGERTAEHAVADLNSDGTLDFVVARLDSSDLAVFVSDGDGGYSEASIVSLGSRPASIRPADLNGDAVVDLLFSQWTPEGARSKLLIGRNDGTFEQPPVVIETDPLTPSTILPADVNGDGLIDLVGTAPGNLVGALLGDGLGGFKQGRLVELPYPPYRGSEDAIELCELNSDGILDLVIRLRDATGVHYVAGLLGDGSGSFFRPDVIVLGESVGQFDVGRFGADDDLDLVFAMFSRSFYLALGNGDGTFESPRLVELPDVSGVFQAADVDGDRRTDLIFPELVSGGGLVIYLQMADGSFDAPIAISTGWNAGPAFFGNFGGDGDHDMAVGNFHAPAISIHRNQCPASCPADFNGDGIVNTLDFLDFLNAYSANDPAADFNGDGVVNTLDFLAFLNAFNEGC